jgi:hypothetical protein
LKLRLAGDATWVVAKHFDRIFPKPGDENLTAAAARALAI